jgi:hypothetical protein
VGGSGKIRVIKSDQVEEPFSTGKLSASIYRAMRDAGERAGRHDALQLAIAIGIYLQRTCWLRVTSDAVGELAVKVLSRCGHEGAAEAMQARAGWRRLRRGRLSVQHELGERTRWDKSWLSCWAQSSWWLSRNSARIIAGLVEHELLENGATVVSRTDVLDMLNRFVAEYGLADAVPVRQ